MSERERGLIPDVDERPPFGGSWRLLYLVVAANLLVLILLFLGFTRAFE